MQPEEFRMLNEKLDRVIELLMPVPAPVQQLIHDYDHNERMQAHKLERLHQKRKWSKLVPNFEELREQERQQDAKLWQAMVDDQTISPGEYALIQRVQARRAQERE